MPFYEYQCENCGHDVEVMQKITDSPLKKCPACGKSGLKRLMSAPVFRLKGSGWYETDFKSDQDSKRNLADKPDVEAPKDDKKDAAKPEKAADSSVAAEAAKPAKEATPATDKPVTADKRKAGRKAAPVKKRAAKAKKSR